MTYRWIIVALFWLIAWSAHAASTINTTLPKDGVPFSPAIIRQNFGAAANDIAALQTMNAGASAPANPTLGTLWLATPQDGSIYTLNIWDGPGNAWLPIGALDVVNNIWMPPIGGGVLPALLSDATVDLGSVPQAAVTVTGAQSIFSFGSSAPTGIIKFVLFSGTPVLVFNSISMILPGLADITTATGDIAIALSLGGGNWQVILYQPSAALIGVTMGGTGRNFLPFPSVLLGEGTNPIGFAIPTTAGVPLLSTGSSTDAAFGPLDLSLPSVTNVLPVGHGGTGGASGPPHSVPIAQGVAPYTFAIPGVAGQLFGSFGPGVDPGFGVTITPGDLPLVDVLHGGTGLPALTPHDVILGEGTSPVGFAAPGTAGLPLISNGPNADPSFQPCNLAGPCVTGILPAANLPPVPTANLLGGAGGALTGITVGSGLAIGGGTLSLACPNFSPSSQGCVPPSGGGTVNFLRADGTFAAPSNNPIVNGTAIGTIGTTPYVITSTSLKLTVVGAGGCGGGGGTSTTGAGGGAAGAAVNWLSGLTVGATLNVTIGAPGACGLGDGGAGGPTIVSSGTQAISTITSTGGGGGQAGSSSPIITIGGAGGNGSGGNFNIPGLPGEDSGTGNGGVGGTNGIVGTFGNGGRGGGLSGAGVAGIQGIVVVEWVQ